MKSIDEQINEVLRLAGVQQLDEGKFKNFGTAALAVAVVLISAKVLNKKIDAKNDLNDIYNNVEMRCQESENFNRKSNPDLTAKDNLEYVITCSLPKYNYSITSGFTADREYDRNGDIENDIYLHAKSNNGQERKIKIPVDKIKALENRVEEIMKDKAFEFSVGLDAGARRGTSEKNSGTTYHYPDEKNNLRANPSNSRTPVIRGIESDF